MNDLIAKIAIAANNQTGNAFDLNHKPLDAFMQKFAELLAKECAKVVNDTEYPYENEADKNVWDTCCVWSAEKLKHHFGVQE